MASPLPKEPIIPKRSFGLTNVVQRAFNVKWFEQCKLIHYDESTDAAFCHVCYKALEEGKLTAGSKEMAFLIEDSQTGKMPRVFDAMNSVITIRMQFKGVLFIPTVYLTLEN